MSAVMRFVPIPTTYEDLGRSAPLWLPLVEKLSKRRGGETLSDILSLIKNFQVQIGLIWDEENNRAPLLLGWEFKRSGDELIAELRWAVGGGIEQWFHLLPEVERYFKEHVKCTIVRPFPRPGWAPRLKAHGYKTTHLVMEKRL